MEWKRFIFNETNIEALSRRGYFLIRMPNKSDKAGYMFFFPTKLIRPFGKRYTGSYNDDFVFNLFKVGKTIIRTEISGDDILDYFEQYKSKYETHIPTARQAASVEIAEELKDE